MAKGLEGYNSFATPTAVQGFSDQPSDARLRPRTEFEKGVKRGTANIQAGLGGAAQIAGQLSGSTELEQYGAQQAAKAEAEASDLTIQGNVESVFDINDLSGAVDWALGGIGSVVPFAAVTIAGGVTGGLFGRGIAKNLNLNQGTGALVGAGTGAVAATTPIESGSIFREIQQESGIDAPVESLVGGFGSSLLNLGGPASLLKRLPGRKSLLGNVAQRAGVTGAVEGVTEAAQEGINIGTRDYVDPRFNALSPESLDDTIKRLTEAGALGAVAGGALGAPAGLVRPDRQEHVNLFAPPDSELAPSLSINELATLEANIARQMNTVTEGNLGSSIDTILQDPLLAKADKADRDVLLQNITGDPSDIIGPSVAEDVGQADILDESTAFNSETIGSAKGFPFPSFDSAETTRARLEKERPEIAPEIRTAYEVVRKDLQDQKIEGKELEAKLVEAGQQMVKNAAADRRGQDPIEYLKSSYLLKTGRGESAATGSGNILARSDVEAPLVSPEERQAIKARKDELSDLEAVVNNTKRSNDRVKQLKQQAAVAGTAEMKKEISTIKMQIHNTAERVRKEAILQRPKEDQQANLRQVVATRAANGQKVFISIPNLVRKIISKDKSYNKELPSITRIQDALSTGIAELREMGIKLDTGLPRNKIVYNLGGDKTITVEQLYSSSEHSRILKNIAKIELKIQSLQNTRSDSAKARLVKAKQELVEARKELGNASKPPSIKEIANEDSKKRRKDEKEAQQTKEYELAALSDKAGTQGLETRRFDPKNTIVRDRPNEGRVPSNQSEQLTRKHRQKGDSPDFDTLTPKGVRTVRKLESLLNTIREASPKEAVSILKNTEVQGIFDSGDRITKTGAIATLKLRIANARRDNRAKSLGATMGTPKVGEINTAASKKDVRRGNAREAKVTPHKKPTEISANRKKNADMVAKDAARAKRDTARYNARKAHTGEKPAKSFGLDQVRAIGMNSLTDLRALDVSKSLPKVQTALTTLANSMNLGVKVEAMSVAKAEAYAKLHGFQDYIAQMEDGSLHGFTTSLRNGKIGVFIHPKLKGALRKEIIAHEFGHVVYRSVTNKLSNLDASLIGKDFNAWANKFGRKGAGELLRSKKTPRAALLTAIDGLDGRNVKDLSDKSQAYLLDFEEWFADGISKYVIDATTEAKTPVQRFFKTIAKFLKTIATRLGIGGFRVYSLGDSLVESPADFANAFSSKAAAVTGAAQASLQNVYSDYAMHGITNVIGDSDIVAKIQNGTLKNQVRKYFKDAKDSELTARAFQLWQQGKIHVGPKITEEFKRLQTKLNNALDTPALKPIWVTKLEPAFSKTINTSDFGKAMAQIPGRYTGKDAGKARRATGYIGEGAQGSSTSKYGLAATDASVRRSDFNINDIVFVSVNGQRAKRVIPVVNGKLAGDYRKIVPALDAGATVVMDNTQNRNRSFNIGEREVYDFLIQQGKYEYKDYPQGGVWRAKTTLASVRAEKKVKHTRIAAYKNMTLAQLKKEEARMMDADPDSIALWEYEAFEEVADARKGFNYQETSTEKKQRDAKAYQKIQQRANAKAAVRGASSITDKLNASILANIDKMSVSDLRKNAYRALKVLEHEAAVRAVSEDGSGSMSSAAAGNIVQELYAYNSKLKELGKKPVSLDETYQEMDLPARSTSEMGMQADQTAAVLERTRSLTEKVIDGTKKFFYTADSQLRETKIPALIDIANMLHVKAGLRDMPPTMWEQKQHERGMFDNIAHRIFKPLNKEEGVNVLAILHNPKSINRFTDKEQAAANKTFQLMSMVRNYMNSAGMKLGKRGDQYFPWIFDTNKFLTKTNSKDFTTFLLQAKFKSGLSHELDIVNASRKAKFDAEMAMVNKIRKYKPMTMRQFAQEIYNNVADNDGVMDFESDVTNTPGMRSTNRRQLDFVRTKGNDADIKYLTDMMSDDLGLTLGNYISQAVKRGEYTRRFGIDDIKLNGMLDIAEREGASPKDLKIATDYINATMGVHGRGTALWLDEKWGLGAPPGGRPINSKLQSVMGSIMVYQNIRLLALATFTSLADPLGIAARTGNLGLVFHGFKEAVKTIFNNNQSEVKDLAEMLGIIDYAVVNEALGWEYGGAYMTGTARKFNEGFFKWSGLTGWTRMTRIMATASATKFIARHVARPNEHSTRYLEELNLTAGDVLLDKDGGLKVLSYAERKTASTAEIARDDKIRAAIVRFVDESILRPNPSQRPPWASDPHYMLAFHLKSFMYSFHDRILKRVWHEMQHGNFSHLVGLMAYVPAMIAADLVREIIQYGGDDPKKANWGMMDYAGSGFVRAGLPGVPGLTAYDIMRDYQYGGIPGISLAGPTIEQITDPSIQKAMPLNSIKWLYN